MHFGLYLKDQVLCLCVKILGNFGMSICIFFHNLFYFLSFDFVLLFSGNLLSCSLLQICTVGLKSTKCQVLIVLGWHFCFILCLGRVFFLSNIFYQWYCNQLLCCLLEYSDTVVFYMKEEYCWMKVFQASICGQYFLVGHKKLFHKFNYKKYRESYRK